MDSARRHSMMRPSLTLVTAPTARPLTLAAAKAHLRVDHDDDDAYIATLIDVATAHVDGRDGVLGRCLVAQTWEYRLHYFPCEILIPLPPLISLDSIQYVDTGGTAQTLDPSVYQVVSGGFGRARVVEAHEQSWPSVRDEPDSVRVTFTAGYVSPSVDSPAVLPDGIPADILAAMKLLIGHLYEHREQVVITGRDAVQSLPLGIDHLLMKYRVGGFGRLS